MRRYSSDIKWFQLSQSWDYLKDINYVRYWVMVCHLDWAMGCPGWVLFWVHLWLYFWLRSTFQSYPSKADCPPQGERHSIQSVQLSCSAMSDSLWPHGLQHARLPCPSPTGACWNSWTSSSWCYLIISCSVIPFSSCLQSFPTSRSFSKESVLHIRWPRYWSFSFSISPSNEYSGLISFRMDWLDLLAVQGTLKSLQHHSSKASVLWCSAYPLKV